MPAHFKCQDGKLNPFECGCQKLWKYSKIEIINKCSERKDQFAVELQKNDPYPFS